jgi:hypothetical protein
MDPVVAVPVAHVDVAVRGDGGVGRPTERLPAHRRRGPEGRADRQDVAAVLRPLPDGLVAAVGGVYMAIDPDADPMREREEVLAVDLAPRVEESPVAVEDHHRVVAPVEDVDVVVCVDADVGHLDERPAFRALEESLDDFVSLAPDVRVHAPLQNVATACERSFTLHETLERHQASAIVAR